MKKITVLLIIVLGLAMASCIGMIYSKMPAYSPSDIRGNNVVIVGKVEYVPSMTKTERVMYMGYGSFIDTIILFCNSGLKRIDANSVLPSSWAMKGSIQAKEGKFFYMLSDNKPFYVIAAAFYKRIYQSGNRVTFESVVSPASFFIDVKPGDKAVYIGTIRYHRDNFFNITRIEILDEYDRVMPEFRRKFEDVPLKKALIREPRQGFEYEVGDPY